MSNVNEYQTNVDQMSTDAQAAVSQSAVPANFSKRSKLGREENGNIFLDQMKSFAPWCWRLTAIGANWRFLTNLVETFLRNSVKSLNWKVSSVPLFCLFWLPSHIFNCKKSSQLQFISHLAIFKCCTAQNTQIQPTLVYIYREIKTKNKPKTN